MNWRRLALEESEGAMEKVIVTVKLVTAALVICPWSFGW